MRAPGEAEPVPCRACRAAPSTGEIWRLCDACFAAFEAKIDAYQAANPGKRYPLSDAEFEWVNEPWADRSMS